MNGRGGDHGYAHFMMKKDFHPLAPRNLEMVFKARQKAAMQEKQQQNLRVQYQKEQELLNNKALLGNEKAKMGLSFIYEPPPGISRSDRRTKDEKSEKREPKFEWQRKYNPPREEYCRGDKSIIDKPFGIEVRNVKCYKCKSWGHQNTDRECPLYNCSAEGGFSNNPSEIIKEHKKQMEENPSGAKKGIVSFSKKTALELASDMQKEHKLTLKRHVMDGVLEEMAARNLIPEKKPNKLSSQDEEMLEFVQSLSEGSRARLFRRIKKEMQSEEPPRAHRRKKSTKRTVVKNEPWSDDDDPSSGLKPISASSHREYDLSRVKTEPGLLVRWVT